MHQLLLCPEGHGPRGARGPAAAWRLAAECGCHTLPVYNVVPLLMPRPDPFTCRPA